MFSGFVLGLSADCSVLLDESGRLENFQLIWFENDYSHNRGRKGEAFIILERRSEEDNCSGERHCVEIREKEVMG